MYTILARFRRFRRAASSAPFLFLWTLVGGLLLLLAPPEAGALDYQTPPRVLVDIIDAPLTPSILLDPSKEWMLLLEQTPLPPITELAERELRLAGLRINPQTSGPSRGRTYAGAKLLAVADGSERAVAGLPAQPRLANVTFSPDGAHFAFTHTTENRIELWVVDVATATARRLSDRPLSLVARITPRWLPDSLSLVVALVPEDRPPEPAPPTAPSGPIVQENLGESVPARTFQDLLANPYDEALFEHYLRSRIARVDLDGKVTALGEADFYGSAEPSPDGAWLLVETLHRPYSYLVPASRFPRRIEIRDRTGKSVEVIADLPLQEGIPIAFGSVATGPRGVTWRDDVPATAVWAEALDGGDAGAEAAERDALYTLAAPFDGEPRRLATLALRHGGTTWGNEDLALVSEWWWKTRKTRTWLVRPGHPEAAPELLFDHSFEDRYSDPGFPLTEDNRWGRPVLKRSSDGKSLFLVGSGASPEGDRPFLDVLDLTTKQTRRLFHSQAPYYERPVEVLDGEGQRIITSREAVEEPPNYFLRILGREGEPRQLTFIPHPTPQLSGMGKELIRYQRADGVDLTGTLYTPPGWTPEDGPLPVVMWAYPQEFKSADAAGQVTDSPYRFDRLGWWSPLLWLTQGYAVLDNPTLPIIGEGEKEPNDTYIEQLVASAAAAIDEVVRRGVGDRRRISIGGHSYGAFMAANLLAHSDLFAAGVAQSGAYNRTLTPFGFQAEERTVWQAPEIYFTMSPFLHADQINEPLLLVHGEADNNSGTFPMQSERFYNALKGLGATARLVMLPYESHGYQARESILHLLWEKYRWLETYVKNRPPEKAPTEALAEPAAP